MSTEEATAAFKSIAQLYFEQHKRIDMRNFQSLRPQDQLFLVRMVSDLNCQGTLRRISRQHLPGETQDDVFSLRESFEQIRQCFKGHEDLVFENFVELLDETKDELCDQVPSYNDRGILERIRKLPLPTTTASTDAKQVSTAAFSVRLPICLHLPDINLVVTGGEYTSLHDVNTAFGVPRTSPVFVQSRDTTYIRCKTLSDILQWREKDPQKPVNIKFGFGNHSRENKTPEASPTKKAAHLEEFETCLPPNYVARKLHRIVGNIFPEVYDDAALQSLNSRIVNIEGQSDNAVLILMAPPGAGKTFSVGYASNNITGMAVEYERYKLCTRDRLNAETLAAKQPLITTRTYSQAKSVFEEFCQNIAAAVFAKAMARLERAENPADIVVVHFDELQVFMTSRVVRSDDSELSDNLLDYLSAMFCDIVWSFATNNDRLRVVLTGTNFYAPLTINYGSAMKYKTIELSGSFPPNWLYEKIFSRYFGCYFDVHADEKEVMMCLESVSANRRCTEHFLSKFNAGVGDLPKDPQDSTQFRQFLFRCRNAAYNEWSESIRSVLPGTCAACVQIVSLLVFPDQFGGTLTEEGISFPRSNVPEDILKYALGGAVSVRVSTRDVDFIKPRGVVWEFLLEQCALHVTQHNSREENAFRTVALSDYNVKGHWLERALCCELSLFDSPMYKILSEKTGRSFDPCVRAMARNFVYDPTIQLISDLGDDIYCVCEDPAFKGQRIVDVGHCAFETATRERVTVYYECKDVANTSVLWHNCYDFFTHDALQDKGDDVVLVFVSTMAFTNSTIPRQAAVKGDKLSAHDCCVRVQKLLAEKKTTRVVIEATDLERTKLLLHVPPRKRPDAPSTSVLTEKISAMYVSNSPAHKGRK